jgi:hypothetical protein
MHCIVGFLRMAINTASHDPRHQQAAKQRLWRQQKPICWPKTESIIIMFHVWVRLGKINEANLVSMLQPTTAGVAMTPRAPIQPQSIFPLCCRILRKALQKHSRSSVPNNVILEIPSSIPRVVVGQGKHWQHVFHPPPWSTLIHTWHT